MWCSYYCINLPIGCPLQDIHVARNTHGNITKLTTSTTGHHVAAADDHNQVMLYGYLPYKHIMRWESIGELTGFLPGRLI